MFSKNKSRRPGGHPLTHAEREKIQTRWITIGFAITAVIILALVGYGILYETVLKYSITIAQVDNEKINSQQFIDRVKLRRKLLVENFRSMYNTAQTFSSNPDLYTYITNQMKNYQTTLDDIQGFGQSVLDQLVNERVDAIEAAKMNITVSDAEIDQFLQGQFDFYPNGTPTPAPTPSQFPTSTLSATQIAILNYTPTPSAQATSTATAITSTPIATQIPTLAVPTAGPTPTPEPTATEYTQVLYDKNLKDYYANLSTDGVSSATLRDYVKYYLLQTKLQNAYNNNPEKQEQVWARHILVKTEADAAIVINRIKSGEDWAKVAAEVSQDTTTKDQGGDLGWFPRGKMVKSFEDVAFSLKIGEISAPVQSDFGWHVIQVVGHETIPLSFSDWIANVKTTMKITTGTEWKAIVPITPTIPADLRLQ